MYRYKNKKIPNLKNIIQKVVNNSNYEIGDSN